jgi:hypothetical protein
VLTVATASISRLFTTYLIVEIQSSLRLMPAYKSSEYIGDTDNELEANRMVEGDPQSPSLAQAQATSSKASALNKRSKLCHSQTMTVKVSSFPDNLQFIFTISTTIVPVPKISYQLKLAPKSELKKQPHKRKNQVRIITLSADLDWDTVKAQILVKIDDCMKSMMLSFDDYELCFTVPRKVSDPAPPAMIDDYSFLLKNVVKCMDKTAYVYMRNKGEVF